MFTSFDIDSGSLWLSAFMPTEMDAYRNGCLPKWMPTEMDAYRNGCRQKWMPTEMYADRNGCRQKWMPTEMDANFCFKWFLLIVILNTSTMYTYHLRHHQTHFSCCKIHLHISYLIFYKLIGISIIITA